MAITLTIDGQEVTAEQDKTLLEIAREMEGFMFANLKETGFD